MRVCGFGIWKRQRFEEGDGKTRKKERGGDCWDERDFNGDNINKIIINKTIKKYYLNKIVCIIDGLMWVFCKMVE